MQDNLGDLGGRIADLVNDQYERGHEAASDAIQRNPFSKAGQLPVRFRTTAEPLPPQMTRPNTSALSIEKERGRSASVSLLTARQSH
jgi:hypothetical protein